ncbi:MAG: adenylate/guanylate cyclase domain-containing protein, partial [Geminicoccaceae bacterium]
MVLVALSIVVTGGFVLALVNRTAATGLRELAKERAHIVSNSIVESVRTHLNPVVSHAAHTARLLGDIDVESTAQDELATLLYASLAASPQISQVALVKQDLTLLRAFRNRANTRFITSEWGDNAAFASMMSQAWHSPSPYWGPLFYAEPSEQTLLSFVTPFNDKTATAYALISILSLQDLSGFVASLAQEMVGQPFILHEDSAVLAHPRMVEVYPGLNDQTPLPALKGFPDPVLSKIWSEERSVEIEAHFIDGLEARVVDVGDQGYVFLFNRLAEFGESEWLVGSYFPLEQLATHVLRERTMIVIGLAVIVANVAIALLLSRLITRPVRRLASAARQITAWKLDPAMRLPTSAFREINEANDAFNAAIGRLRSLQSYVPERLATRLLREPRPSEIVSEQHDVTVLFTDIVGFTEMVERMAAADVVELLNRHFSLVASCIKAEDGIVDKYIGASAMAFWGGLEDEENHATGACRAAQQIMDALGRENERRRTKQAPPIRVRIGIHSGPAMVGNIGS